MNIHEYQAAEIFARHGIPINQGIVCTSPSEVESAANKLGGTVVIKAQVHSGGRGKAGGVKVAKSASEARETSEKIFGLDIRGHVVHKVLVAPAVGIQSEFYLGVVIDRAARGVTIMASSEGGIDIEEVAANTPEKIHREVADPMLGLHGYQARRLGFALGIDPKMISGFARITQQLYQAFIQSDGSLAEINPLIITTDNTWQAIDSKMVIDNNALYRHKDFESMRDLQEEVATEVEARAAGISFVKLDGNIGCVVNGAGLSMATMDAIKLYGGEPANFLDVGGGASAQQVTKALELVLSDPSVNAILINIFGGITRGDVVARGLLEALNTIKLNVPLVVRLVGTNQKEGREILAGAGITTVDTMNEAAERVVAAARDAA